MARHFNISGELTQQLLAPGDNVKVTGISLTNVQKVSKCKVDLYMEKQFEGKFYILKNIELPIGVTLEHDFSINNYTDEYGLYIKLTDGASFTLTGSIDPIASTGLTSSHTTGTAFLSEVSVGDEIVVNSETRTVSTITGDDALVVTAAFTNTGSDGSPDCNPTALVDVIIN